jgi:hypothetical protein
MKSDELLATCYSQDSFEGSFLLLIANYSEKLPVLQTAYGRQLALWGSVELG